MTDPRIQEIEGLIDSGNYDILSLDIFDTVVWRTVPRPKDLFFGIAEALLENDVLWSSTSPESFVKERVTAEERARRRRPSFEVTLEQIYAEFPKGFLRGTDRTGLVEIELQHEERSIRVNPDMRGLIERAGAAGLQVAFVSDTYFTTEQIQRLVGITPDHLMLSCEQNRSKVMGLHALLMERTGTPAGRILHVGNDYRADIEGPAALEIDRFWFRQWPDEYETLSELELPHPLTQRRPFIGESDGGITALRGEAMLSVPDPYQRWGAGVLGPVLGGFGDWVVSRCRELETPTVLCLMREGRLLRNLLTILDPGLDAREFFISRFAARLASVFDASESELLGMVQRPSATPRGTLLEQLGLDPDALGDPETQIEPADAHSLVKEIGRHPKLKRRVLATAKAARQGLLRHLDTVLEGRTEGKVAVVDLGYTGTIQSCLERILQKERPGLSTHGLYLVTGGRVHETQAVGATVEGWLAENGQPSSIAHTFMRSPEIVEQCMMAPCGTTLGYAPDGTPQLDDFRCPVEQRDQIAKVQRGVLGYVTALKTMRETQNITSRPVKALYEAICIRSVTRPLPVELELFGGWKHDENFGSEQSRGLVEVAHVDPWEMEHMSPHQLASLPSSRLYWPFGLACTVSPSMGEAVRGIFLRSVHPEAFDAPFPTQVMAVYWDTGRGFHTDEAEVLPYQLNNRNRLWKRFTFRVDGTGAPRRVGFSIGTRNQMVQLAGCNLHMETRDGVRATRHLDHDTLQRGGYDQLHDNLYLVTDDPALFVLPIEDLPEDVDRVDIDVFFGVLMEAQYA